VDKILFIVSIILLAIGVGGFIWRLFFGPFKPRDEKNPSSDITNLELYQLLSNDTKWIIAFQTGILAGLLIMILSKL
jgi:nitrogen fixation-related uncharacterized protein